ncbi:MAG: ABC transporter ATP-binding protein [Candidatus Kariarchaeaceae archaeon]|jgi:putative ABC transport system ATP-binding protein
MEVEVITFENEVSITLDNVSKIYDMGVVQVHALKNVSLEIPKGQFIVILGPSGSGKTTLLNLLGAIDTPSVGRVSILDNDLTKLNRGDLAKIRRNHMGFVFQFFNLLPTLSARENVEYALQIQGKKGTKGRAIEVLKQVGLDKRADHYPGELSGGEQQRVAIARALAKAPPVILADEPTGELDYETGIAILELLHELSKKGHTVVMVTHNSEIAKIANRVVRLRSGEVVSDELNPKPVAPKDLRW